MKHVFILISVICCGLTAGAQLASQKDPAAVAAKYKRPVAGTTNARPAAAKLPSQSPLPRQAAEAKTKMKKKGPEKTEAEKRKQLPSNRQPMKQPAKPPRKNS